MKILKQNIWLIATLALLLAFNLSMNHSFFDIRVVNGHLFGSLIDILFRAVPLLLTALGMTLVIATGGVDLSVGSIAAVSAAVAGVLIAREYSLVSVVSAAIAAAITIGIWNGFLVSRLKLQPIIATLIAMVAGRGLAQLIVDGQVLSIDGAVGDQFGYLGGGFLGGLPFSIYFAAAAFAALALFSRKTAAGLFVEAVGSNENAAKVVGIPRGFVLFFVYAASGLCAGLAGLVSSSNIHAVDVNNLGLYLELDAILAVVIGGTKLTGGRFSLIGTLLGALIIQAVATTIPSVGIPVELMLVVKAVVVILICLFQSEKMHSFFRTRPSRKKAVPL